MEDFTPYDIFRETGIISAEKYLQKKDYEQRLEQALRMATIWCVLGIIAMAALCYAAWRLLCAIQEI